jgi:hypothetical protein
MPINEPAAKKKTKDSKKSTSKGKTKKKPSTKTS